MLTAGKGDAPLLTSVTAAYLPRNMRPRVTSITIHPPGTVFQRPFPIDPEIAGFEGDLPDKRREPAGRAPASPSLGRRMYEKGLMTFVWRAEDDNRDDLTYDVFYRREGETSWKPLKRGMTDQILVWDTTSVPNGRYMVRIVASDAPSNSPATALTGARESTAFAIDNVPPVDHGHVGRDATTAAPPSPSTSATRIRRCRRWTTRSTATGGSRSIRRTASRTRASNSSNWCWKGMRCRAASRCGRPMR